MSESTEPLRNGPESPFVVTAVEAVLRGDAGAGRDTLERAAQATSWGAVSHRLDVAGRALALEVDVDGPEAVDWSDAVDLLGGEVAEVVAVEAARVHSAWAAGESGLAVTIDLTGDEVDVRTALDHTWPALLVLTWLVERAGYPPQVVV